MPPPPGAIGTTSLPYPIPSKGAQKLLIILADFSDEPGTFTQNEIYQRFFGPGGFSEYFYEVSNGQLAYSGDVVGISGGNPVINSNAVAFVRLPHPKSYYSRGEAGVTTGPFPENLAGIYHHALLELEAAGFDFAPYADADKVVQNVVVLFAGRSSVESGNQKDLQPTSITLSYYFANGAYQNNAGYKFGNFTVCPEREDNRLFSIGVCVHEHGHNLGLPDLYDLSYNTTGIGYAGVMAFGTYGGAGTVLGPGARPFHPSAFSKVQLGWITPLDAPTSGTIVLAPVEEGGQVLKFAASSNASEYFLLENRQARGFDDQMQGVNLCPGLFLWHIDENVYHSYKLWNMVNSPSLAQGPPHNAVRLVEADGRRDLIQPRMNYGQCSDTFVPGSRWGAGTTVPATYWNGIDSGFSFSVVSDTNGTVTIEIESSDVPPTATPTVTPTPTKTPGPQPTVAPTPTPSRLKGKITATVNKKSIAGLLELRGVDRATKRLSRLVLLNVRKTGETYTTTMTRPNGRFKFRKIPPGNYVIQIENLSRKVKIKRVKGKERR